jgi:polycystin 1L2
MIVFSIVSIGMYVMKNMFTTLAMKAVRESELSEFVNFNTIALWDDTFATILAVVSFCATLKFLKLLRFNKRIGMLAETLKYASDDLKSFSFTFIVFMLAYAQFGFLLFSSSLQSYRNFMSAIESVFLLLLGQFEVEMFDANPILGFLFFISFIFIIIVGLMAIFMTILTDAFETVKSDLENKSDDAQMFSYMFNSLKKATGMDKRLKKKKEDDEEEEMEDKKEEDEAPESLKRTAGSFGSTLSMINIRQMNKVEPAGLKNDAAVL